MREALRLTEGNLGSLIASRQEMGAGDHTVISRLMLDWREAVRRALSDIPTTAECICPRCGIRHGRLPIGGDF